MGPAHTYARAMARTLDMACGIEVQHGRIMFGPQLLRALLTSVPMAFQRPVVRRDAFVKTGFYTEDCLLWDCDWAMRAAVTVSTALLNEPLYLQRLDGQGSSSKNSRELEHIRSGIEIVERLARELSSAQSDPGPRRGCARERRVAWFHLAYFLVHSGEPADALRAWVQSQRRKLDLRRFDAFACSRASF